MPHRKRSINGCETYSLREIQITILSLSLTHFRALTLDCEYDFFFLNKARFLGKRLAT